MYSIVYTALILPISSTDCSTSAESRWAAIHARTQNIPQLSHPPLLKYPQAQTSKIPWSQNCLLLDLTTNMYIYYHAPLFSSPLPLLGILERPPSSHMYREKANHSFWKVFGGFWGVCVRSQNINCQHWFWLCLPYDRKYLVIMSFLINKACLKYVN